MTAAAWTLLGIAVIVAVVDWWAVATDRRPVEYVAKPLTMVVLIAAALALDPVDETKRAWFVAALVLSLAGDVFLLPQVDRFVPGLASFLLAHVAYVVGFWSYDEGGALLLAVLVVPALGLVAGRVTRAVRAREPELAVPVAVYIVVIGAMIVSALAFGDGVAIAGALLFGTSDSILALGRFERERQWGPIAVMTTYHLAQGLLVLSL